MVIVEMGAVTRHDVPGWGSKAMEQLYAEDLDVYTRSLNQTQFESLVILLAHRHSMTVKAIQRMIEYSYILNFSKRQRRKQARNVVDSKGMVWGTGEPLTRFDPETNTFHDFAEVPTAYGLALDKEENVWFSEFSKDGKIGKVDAKTGKVIKYQQPTAGSWPRRLKIDAQGNVWFCEYEAGKIGRFDPKTESFKEYALPGGRPTPYALVIDKNTGHLWFSSMEMDTVSELDPATGKITLYPFLFPENGMRDFFQDADGRIWWGSQANNRVGYFYLAGSAASQHAALAAQTIAK